MFTKNWYIAISSTMTKLTQSYTNLLGEQKNTNGGYPDSFLGLGYDYGTNTNTACPSMYKALNTMDGGGGIIFGDGNTPPTYNDYTLSGNLITTIATSTTVNKNIDDTGVTITSICTLTNNGSESITVAEVGLIGQLYTSTGAASQKSYKALFERTVLETPVTIPAGGVGQVTYTVRFNHPTA